MPHHQMKLLVAHLPKKSDRAYSKKEMKIDSSEEISSDFLNENDTQQSPSYSVKETKIIFMWMPF